jgi:hypothetical protein
LDGRTFELDDSNDVDWDNKGILVAPEVTGSSAEADASLWRVVSWDEFKEIRFRHDTMTDGGR